MIIVFVGDRNTKTWLSFVVFSVFFETIADCRGVVPFFTMSNRRYVRITNEDELATLFECLAYSALQ